MLSLCCKKDSRSNATTQRCSFCSRASCSGERTSAAKKQIAEQIASTTSDTKRKAEADEIVKAVYDYTQAKAAAAMPVRLNITLGERMGLVVLKRSWLTDDDVAAIDRERDNNNYNRIIIRAVSGEQQIVGHIESITCSGSSIAYRVRTADGVVASFSSPDFSGVKMTVAREGDNTFQIGCGATLPSSWRS